MVTIDPADEAPEGLTGAEFVEWMKKHKKPVRTETVADEEVEPIAKPTIKGRQVGQMRAVKGGKPAGEVGEFKSHKGYYVPAHTFRGKHPTLAKAIDIGEKAVSKVGKFVDEEILHHGEEEEKEKTEEEKKEEEKVKEKKKKTQKKLTGIEKKLKKELLDGEDDEDEPEDKVTKTTKKSQILSRGYESAYSPSGGIGGTRGYEAAYKGAGLGSGSYQPAYKATVQSPNLAQPARGRVKESETEEIPQPRAPLPTKQPDRFNIQNWQSMGFPNTLPQSARGSLFRPAPPRPQPTVVPMVRQPYQPRPTPQPTPPMRAPARAPMSGPIPKIGLNLNTMPQLMKPRATIATPRAPGAPAHTKVPVTTPFTFMGVNLNEKKKLEPKPITNMGAGYKNVPLTVMNGIYPKAGYNPKADPITKKSIIPKISADITPNNFTMFGMKMKNRKNI